MITRFVQINSLDLQSSKLERAANILKTGGLVAFPTETVYGLGANAFDDQAVKKIFSAKGRPQDNPLIVHIWNKKQLNELVQNVSQKAQILINNFWPGPLTIVFSKKTGIMAEATAELPTVGVRMPDHPVALQLLKMSEVPVAAPSANISGKPSPTNGKHVLKDLAGKVDMVIDGGSSRVGVESTVVDCTGDIPLILRPGGITKEEMSAVVGEIRLHPGLAGTDTRPASPGMKYTHYAPDGIMHLILGNNTEKLVNKMAEILIDKYRAGYRVALLAFEETLQVFPTSHEKISKFSLGSKENLQFAAARIYSLLRHCDRLKIDYILAEGCSREGMGLAVMNRLEKAAGGKIITL